MHKYLKIKSLNVQAQNKIHTLNNTMDSFYNYNLILNKNQYFWYRKFLVL